jgi:hypothetical protein
MNKTKKTSTPPVVEQEGDKFAAIKAAQKCLNDLKKEMERDDHQNVAFICACKNNDNHFVRGIVAGNTRHLAELLASMMEKDKDLEEVIMSATIMSL